MSPPRAGGKKSAATSLPALSDRGLFFRLKQLGPACSFSSDLIVTSLLIASFLTLSQPAVTSE